MSETLNVNVLVAAKEEYTKQLVYILSPQIYLVLLNVFNESQLIKKKRSISLRNYQLFLKKIPHWNTVIIEKNTENIKVKIPYLLDLITAIFVSHVKILACVRLKSDSKSINVKVPNLDHFLHQIIITNAEKIYYNPELILKKKEIVVSVISETIEETIRNQIPIDKILTEYLSGVFENDSNEQLNNELQNSSLDNQDNISDNESNNVSDNESVDEDIESEAEERDDLDQPEESEENKSIEPSRPLPASQIDSLPPFEQLNDEQLPTTEIKNRVLFSDAKESINKENKENVDEQDSESDDGPDFDSDND